ncbi:hypothetical protein ACHAQH_007692 [Verticillium albo-atrum]
MMAALSSTSNRDSFDSAILHMSEINEIRGAKGSSKDQAADRKNRWWKKANMEVRKQAHVAKNVYKEVKQSFQNRVNEWMDSTNAFIWGNIGPRDALSDVEVPLMRGVILETVKGSVRRKKTG